MLNKLKRTFILINMVSVMSIMGVILSFLYFSNSHNAEENIKQIMTDALIGEISGHERARSRIERSKSQQGFGITNNPSFLPTLLFKLDNDQNILEKKEREITIEDDLAKELIQSALDGHRDQIPILEAMQPPPPDLKIYEADNGLRYTLVSSGEFIFMLFADNRLETEHLRRLFILCAAIFISVFFAFLLFSIHLSKWALRPVEKAWAQQSRFIGDASHELRTPITVILANLEILLGKQNETIQHNVKWLLQSKSEADRMKTLVEDLLFLARAESDHYTLKMQTIHLSDCLMECVLNLEVLAFEKGITIKEEISEHLYVHANESSLKQLFTILLDNALKYCNNKKIVKVTAFQKENTVFVRVFNTASPFEKEVQEHLFDRFYRAEASRQRSEGGYGLGLSIAGNIAAMHRAKLYAQNESDGVVFVLELKAKNRSQP